ncbi:hypothetical protein D0T50_01160 [Bacteroides sp. 214]|uniref:pectinesterase family protein n=1 Tax=Bacteroides sp. 214 TaxID=2302935 RepID=UPI0013D827EC|nr:pectinesterase family protein [Bacteroides sp. 214]NDW11497.1 hypothetical protein [Bacteroides sp. 214]
MKKSYLSLFLCLLGFAVATQAQVKIVEWNFAGTYNADGKADAAGSFSAKNGKRFDALYPDYSVNESGVLSAKTNTGYSNVDMAMCHETPSVRIYYMGQNNITDYTNAENHDNYFQYAFSTKGYQDIALDFSFACNGDATTYFRLVYSTDGGTTWVDAGSYAEETAYQGGDWWNITTHNVPLTGLKNKENVIVRLIGGNDASTAKGSVNMTLFKVTGKEGTATVQERMLYTTNFQDWDALGASATATDVKKTTIQGETLTFTLLQAAVNPSGYDAQKFTDPVSTVGYIQTQKTGGDANSTYILLSPLANVTKLSFVQAATGGKRGLMLKVKGDGDADWVYLHNVAIGRAQGELLEFDVNRTNVQICFESFERAQNGYLLELNIKGNVEITEEQAKLTTSVSPKDAGIVTVSPPGNEYNVGTELTLTAAKEFGYKFVKWTDAEGNELSTSATYTFEIKEDANVIAVFEAINTYSLTWTATGGANSYLVAVSPKGKVVDGVNYYEEGTDVKVTASNNRIMNFTNWEDNTTAVERVITMTENKALVANYSADEFIMGWDFMLDQPGSDRAADYYVDSENTGKFSLRKADGTTNGWLTKGLTNGMYEGRYGVVNWKPFADKYYYELTFATTGFTNVAVEAAMLYNYNAYAVQKVEYSLDGETFTQLGQYDFETVKTWYDKRFELPEAAWGKERVYVRFIPDYTSNIVGTTSDNDGTSMTDVYILGESANAEDKVPPVLLSSIPGADNNKGISTTGSIILTFDERVVAGTGKAMLNGKELEVNISGKTAIFKYMGLSYNESYTFVLPEGAITDRNGNVFAGTSITFQTLERVQPAARLYDAVVAADGSGDYTTVIDAIAAAPSDRVSPWLIFIKEGTYKGHIEIPATKPYIYLIGQDVDKVIITDDQLCGGEEAQTGKPALHVSLGATVVVQAANFFAENISFENSWGVEKNAGPQALALYTNNDRAILNNCKLRSYQDTYLTSTKTNNDRHYLKNCFIEGAVDFIYGGGDVYFDGCVINIVRESGGYIVAPSHGIGTKWGYVFMNNTITAATNPAGATSVWLGRPWQNAPKTVFINTIAEVTIPAAGWYETMGAIPAIFADYNTMDADGNPVDLSNRRVTYYRTVDGEKVYGDAKNSLTADEAATYTIQNVLSGSDAWLPHLMTEAIAAPVVTKAEATYTWEAVPYAISYVVSVDGKVVAFTKETSYTVTDTRAEATVTVQAVNEYGGLSAASSSNPGTGIDKVEDNAQTAISHSVIGGVLYLKNLPENARIEIYNFLGQKRFDEVVNAGQAAINLPESGIVRVRTANGYETFKVMK